MGGYPVSRAHNQQSVNSRQRLAQSSTLVLAAAVAFSVLFHVGSLVGLQQAFPAWNKSDPKPNTTSIRFKLPPAPDQSVQRILENKQSKTEAPDKATYLSETNHRTDRETRVERDSSHRPGAEVGPRGNTLQQPKQINPQTTDARNKEAASRPRQKSEIAALMPSANELLGRMNAGYQDFIDESIDLGEAVDINTAEYRYVGYFSSMRKSIELVWNYPYEAAMKGIEGKVLLAFSIEPDGKASRIKVIESSGHKLLDDAIVKAIKLASPFAPLPENFEQERLTIKGAFHYRLNSLMGAH